MNTVFPLKPEHCTQVKKTVFIDENLFFADAVTTDKGRSSNVQVIVTI